MYTYHCKFDMYYNSDEIKDSYSYYHYNYYYYLYNYYYYSIFGLYLHNWEIVVIQLIAIVPNFMGTLYAGQPYWTVRVRIGRLYSLYRAFDSVRNVSSRIILKLVPEEVRYVGCRKKFECLWIHLVKFFSHVKSIHIKTITTSGRLHYAVKHYYLREEQEKFSRSLSFLPHHTLPEKAKDL